MNKVICIAIVFILLFQAVCFAESINLDELSVEELIELRSEIDKRLNKKEVSNTTAQSWYDYGLGQYLPDPSEVLGRTVNGNDVTKINTDSSFYETIEDATMGDLDVYINALRDFGYTEGIQSYGTGWIATMNEKYQVAVAFVSFASDTFEDHITVTVDIVK